MIIKSEDLFFGKITDATIILLLITA